MTCHQNLNELPYIMECTCKMIRNFVSSLPGTLNVHNAKPGNSEQMSAADSNKPSADEEGLDNRYLEGDYSEVDPAILEKLAVYIARYSYDPVQHSPNENPEMELAFQAGDYLYVFGEMDEVNEVKCVLNNSVKT